MNGCEILEQHTYISEPFQGMKILIPWDRNMGVDTLENQGTSSDVGETNSNYNGITQFDFRYKP